MKNIFAICFSLLFALGLTGCGEQKKPEAKYDPDVITELTDPAEQCKRQYRKSPKVFHECQSWVNKNGKF